MKKLFLFRSLSIISGLFLVLIIFILIEAMSYILLKSSGKSTYKLILNIENDDNMKVAYEISNHVSYLDPHLGYSIDINKIEHVSYVAGFAIYGDQNNNNIKLVTLGGSTTDPINSYIWPKLLQSILQSKKYRSQILNGGVAGYSSNQELIKLIRDVLPYNPDIIISFNGINDIAFIHSIPTHPMVHPYQKIIFNKLLAESKTQILPNTTIFLKNLFSESHSDEKSVNGINFGTTYKSSPAKQWERNIRLMHAISAEFGINYLCFLQPTLGIGKYNMSSDEKIMFNKTEEKFKNSYKEMINSFYINAKNICKYLSYCIDLTDVFEHSNNVYRDTRHPNKKGYKIIANTIFQEIKKKELIKEN